MWLYTLFKPLVYVCDKILKIYQFPFMLFFLYIIDPIVTYSDKAKEGFNIRYILSMLIICSPVPILIYVREYTEYRWVAENVVFALQCYIVSAFLLWVLKTFLSPTEDELKKWNKK